MVKKNTLLFFLLGNLYLIACFEKEQPLSKHTSSVKAYSLQQSLYENAIYFSFSNDSAIKKITNQSWDLGFEAADSGWHIILNTSRFMLVANTGKKNMEEVNSTENLKFNFDASMGSLDSTAIGKWGKDILTDKPEYSNDVYIIDLGVDNNGSRIGYKKIQFLKLEEKSYIFTFCNIDGSEMKTDTIKKNPKVNFVYYSFSTPKNQTIQEPDNTSWDIVFQQYTTLLYENGVIPTPYIVRGVLLNPKNTKACVDSLSSFLDITISNTSNYSLSNIKDYIGYNWKLYVGDTYLINSKLNYIIKNQYNEYYKFRIISFYGKTGEKGYPEFEYQKL